MLASEWAKQSAINDYGIAEEKITVVPLGPNIDHLPATFEINKQRSDTCNLLFLGVEWERKGGQIAIDTYQALKKRNFNCTLTIIGCVPPFPVTEPGIKVIPFLNRGIEAEAHQLVSIIKQSHFLLLPTRAECAGVVFCEAAAYGLPSVTTSTGGVPTYVKNNITGITLPPEAGGEAYAEKIITLYANDAVYQQLCSSSRSYYEETLNWNAWGNSFNIIAEAVRS